MARTVGALAGSLLLVAFVGAIAVMSSGSDEPPAPKILLDSAARAAQLVAQQKADAEHRERERVRDHAFAVKLLCQDEVKARLKAPATAKFQRVEYGTDFGRMEDGRYVARGTVDAQNAFGALLRNRYECVFSFVSGDTYKIERVTIAP